MINNKKIFLSSPHMSDQGFEQQYVQEAFNTNWIAPLGPHVDMFEKSVSKFIGVSAAAALSSGTAAIHLALRSLGVSKGDYVFCSSLTFAASCYPIIYENAIPVMIDSEPSTWNMSPKALEKAFAIYQPKAVIVVNLYGQSADMDPIKAICDQYNVPIIEDAAESLGASYKGKMSGTFGEFGVFSFNGNKIITTSGGGMLVSNNVEKIDKVRFWATQSRDKARHYEHSEIGYNYRLSNICAAIGCGQMQVLEERILKKKTIFETYKEAFEDINFIEMMPIADCCESNYWLSCMTIKDHSNIKPIDIILELEKNSIESRPIWKPMHLQPVFKSFSFFSHTDGTVSVSEDIFNRGLCLPSDTKMSSTEQQKIINIIKELFSHV